MALNHIPQGACRFIKGGALLHSEGLRGRDLNVVNVIAIPKRLENSVPKSQRQKILDRIFPQKMIDPIDLRLVEDFENCTVELSGRGKVVAKGFFDDDADPRVIGRWLRQARCADLADHLGINGGRRREIIQAVALQVALAVEFFKAARKLCKRVRLIVIPGDVYKGLREVAKVFILDVTGGVLAHGPRYGLLKSGVAHFTAREANYGESPGERLASRQFEERRDQLAAGEIAGRAQKNDHPWD